MIDPEEHSVGVITRGEVVCSGRADVVVADEAVIVMARTSREKTVRHLERNVMSAG
jgi:hypothetical protein